MTEVTGSVRFILGDLEMIREFSSELIKNDDIDEYLPGTNPSHPALLTIFAIKQAQANKRVAIPLTSVMDFREALNVLFKSAQERLLKGTILLNAEMIGSDLSNEEAQDTILQIIRDTKAHYDEKK